MRTHTGMWAAAVVATVVGVGSAQAPPPAQTPRSQSVEEQAPGRQGDTPAPARKPGEGEGPFKKLVIRGVTLIDGTGGPPLSPMDIVIEGNRITAVRQA